MTKLKQLIGEGRAIFATVLCLLSFVLLAPSAQAETLYKEYVCTDNQWETQRNPFAKPTSLPHWISALCFHDNYTNYQGYVYGIRGRLMHGTWFLGTNTYYCVSQPRDSTATPNPIFENSVRVINWRQGDNIQTTPSDRTCLAQIQRDTEAALKAATDDDTKVGKNVALAICKLLRPHELEGKSGTAQPPAGITLPYQDQNGAFFSNLVANVGVMFRNMSYSNPLAGQCLDGHTFYEGDKTIGFDCYRTNSKGIVMRECLITPKEMLNGFDKYYRPGLMDCIATLDQVPDDWGGTYLLHNRGYKQVNLVDDFVFTNAVEGGAAVIQKRPRTVTDPDAWPMFDEDVNLDRADVLLLKFACYALDTASKLAQSYQLPEGEVGRNASPEIRQFTQWQENFHSVGYSEYIRAQHDEGPDNILHCGYAERIECAVHGFFHEVPFLLKTVDDTSAMAAARASFVSALECFLDADAFVTGEWPSATGHNYGGQRDTEQLHLFEFVEPEAGEDGGEWNIAGYRELARKAYASLTGKGTAAASQTVDLVQLGKALDIHAGSQGSDTPEHHGVLDFSGLGPEKDGKVAIDLNPLFDGTVTPRSFVTDVDTCITTNGPAHWVENRYGHNAYRNKMRYYPTVGSNLVGRLLVKVSNDTVSPTLCGVYPSGTLVDDLKTMSLRYSADGGANRSGFAKRLDILHQRTEVTTENSPYVLEEGKTYTAAPTKSNGGAFVVNSGATLTGTNVTFAGNETTEYAGAIYNNGTVVLVDATFTGNKAKNAGAIYNNGGTLSLANTVFDGNSATVKGGAILSTGTVNLDGPVMLMTDSDILYNKGTLNWNLAGGKTGSLGGYEKLSCYANNTKLQLTVDDATKLPAVIATGDFSDVKGKDTFTIANVTSGATESIKIGGIANVDGVWYTLSVKSGVLTLDTPPTAKLSGVPVIDKATEPWTTNATAKVYAGGYEIALNDDGTYTVPQGVPLRLDYAATDDYMFAAGLKEKSVYLENGITGDTSMDETGVKPVAEARWADVREISIDTRERIVVGSPNEVLPLAYSTNNWDKVTDAGDHWTELYVNDTMLVKTNQENGYKEWRPAIGAYGPYDVKQEWWVDGMSKADVNVTIYYSQPYALTWSNEGGTIAATASGETIASGDKVLGEDIVRFTAKQDEGYVLSRKGFTVLTNGVEIVDAVKGDEKSGYRFDMPNSVAAIKSAYVKASGVTVNGEDIALGYGDGWAYDEAKGVLTLDANDATVPRATLSGFIAGGVQIVMKGTAFKDGLVLENFTNDVTGVDGAVALAINVDTAVEIVGDNYLAAGANASAVAATSSNVDFSGDGLLFAAPGKDDKGALLPGIKVSGGSVRITDGTYTSSIDPTLVPWNQTGRTYNTAAVANNDDLGSWTVKDVGVIQYEIGWDPYHVVTNDVDALLEPPTPPTEAGKVFKGWLHNAVPVDFATDTPKTLGAQKDNKIILQALFDSAATSPSSTVVPKGGDTPVVVDTFEKAEYFAPDGGEVKVCNTDLVAKVEKPLIIKKGEGATLDITPGDGLDKKVADDGTVYIGEETNGVIVVEQDAGTEVKVAAKPADVRIQEWNQAQSMASNVTTEAGTVIVDKSELDAATKLKEAQDADALVSSLKLEVTAIGVATNGEAEITQAIFDMTPVLTISKVKDGVATDLVVKTNDFVTSREPMLVTIPCGGIKPVAIIHNHNGVANVLRSTTDTIPAVGYFVYDAINKAVTFAIDAFSKITIIGDEDSSTFENYSLLTGEKSGKTIVVDGDGNGVISNATLTATESITLEGDNVLVGSLELVIPPEGVITNKGSLTWNLSNDNTGVKLSPFDAIEQTPGSALKIMLDAQQTGDSAVTNDYVIAEDAAGADGLSVALEGPAPLGQTNLTVNGEALYIGSKAYSLATNDNGQLVFKLAFGKFAITYDAAPGKWFDGAAKTVIDAYVNKGYEFPAANPFRSGFVFAGWYRSWSNGSERVTALDVNKSPVQPLEAHSLYARWVVDASSNPDALSDLLPGGEPRVEITANDGFVGNRKVTVLDMPLYVRTIRSYAFRGATALRTVNFVQPRDYADFSEVPLVIEDYAFGGATALESVTIPSCVLRIGYRAFQGCRSLKDVYILGDLNGTTLGGEPFAACGEVTIHLSPAAMANEALVSSITSGSSARVVVDARLSGELSPSSYEQFEVGEDTVTFKVNASALPKGTPVNLKTVSALYATSLTGVSTGQALLPLSVNGPDDTGRYTIVFPKPVGSSGFFRLAVNPQNDL